MLDFSFWLFFFRSTPHTYRHTHTYTHGTIDTKISYTFFVIFDYHHPPLTTPTTLRVRTIENPASRVRLERGIWCGDWVGMGKDLNLPSVEVCVCERKERQKEKDKAVASSHYILIQQPHTHTYYTQNTPLVNCSL